MNNQKHKSVLHIHRLGKHHYSMLPVAVKSARGTSFTGRDCSKCIVMDHDRWTEESLEIMISLLLLAPISFDEEFDNWETEVSEDTLPIKWHNKANGLITYCTDNTVRVETWIKRSSDSAPTFGKVSMFPSWSPFKSGEMFNFYKMPTQNKFLSETKKLFADPSLD